MRFVFFVIALALAGCSTTQISEKEAAYVPSDRIYAPEMIWKNNSTTMASVTFIRDAGLYGSGCDYDLSVNNTKVARFYSGEMIRVALKPGQYFFTIDGVGICSTSMSQNTMLSAGSDEFYRILFGMDAIARFTRTK